MDRFGVDSTGNEMRRFQVVLHRLQEIFRKNFFVPGHGQQGAVDENDELVCIQFVEVCVQVGAVFSVGVQLAGRRAMGGHDGVVRVVDDTDTIRRGRTTATLFAAPVCFPEQ